MSFKFYRYWDSINSTYDDIWVIPRCIIFCLKSPVWKSTNVVAYMYSIFSLFLMLLTKWQMIFCETVTIIYDLGPGIKLLLPHFTLLPWPSNFYFYRAIYFKERTKIYWIQHVRSKKSILVYRVMQREYKSVLECCLMLLNAILCRSLVKQKVKMDHFDLNFYRIL